MKKILLLAALLLTACATTVPVAPVNPTASQTADIDAKVEVLRRTLK